MVQANKEVTEEKPEPKQEVEEPTEKATINKLSDEEVKPTEKVQETEDVDTFDSNNNYQTKNNKSVKTVNAVKNEMNKQNPDTDKLINSLRNAQKNKDVDGKDGKNARKVLQAQENIINTVNEQRVKQGKEPLKKEQILGTQVEESTKEDIQETPIENQSEDLPELEAGTNVDDTPYIEKELTLEEKIKKLNAVEYRNYLRTGKLPKF